MEKAALSIPTNWSGITPEWMTTALSSHFPDVEVADVSVLFRDDGTNRRARLGVIYSAGNGPATVFAKASDPAHSELNARMGGLFNEPRLFQSAVDLRLDRPAPYAAVIDEPGFNYVIVMEDVSARGADPLDATRSISVEQAKHGVRALARMHSGFWGRRIEDYAALAWVEPYVPWTGMGSKIPVAIELMGDTCPKEVQAMTVKEIIEDNWAPYVDSLTRSPQTFLHGDAHIGNTYALPDNEIGFLDWQVVRRGNWSVDIGYFLQGALTVEDRRRHEREILDEYRSALELSPEERPSAGEVFLRYRASASHGLAVWLATLSRPGWQRTEVSLSLAQRYSAAFVDLETRAAVEAVRS